MRCFGPLGLAFRQITTTGPPWTLRVLPRFASRRHLPEKLARLRSVDGATAIRGRGQGTEFDSLREYVLGDDVRSIDWRASARRSDVMVRTWRPERDRRVVCVLDTGRTSAVRVGDEPRLDAAIDAALLLAAVAQEAGDQVDLLAADTRCAPSVSGVARPQPAAPAGQRARAAAAGAGRDRLRAGRQRGAAPGAQARLVVLFTALEPGALGEGLLPVLPRLVARHPVLVAAVHDPALRDLAGRSAATAPPPSTPPPPGPAALAERHRVARR